MITGKTIALTRQTFVGKVLSLLLNMLSRLVIAFLPRSKHLLISWLQSPSAVLLEPKKIVCHCCHCFPSVCHEVMGLDAMILVFWMLNFKPTFFTLLFHFHQEALVPLHFLPLQWHYLRMKLLIFLLAILISACDSSCPAFRMMYSAFKLNKQWDSIQLWHLTLPIWTSLLFHIWSELVLLDLHAGFSVGR